MNNVVLIGRLTKDPELRYTAGGTVMCRFTLAVDKGLSRDKKAEAEQSGKATADFISCTAWGKTAELISHYVFKGNKLAVRGRIQTSSFDKQDGTKGYSTDVVTERVEFLESRKDNYIRVGKEADYGLGEDTFPLDIDDIPF